MKTHRFTSSTNLSLDRTLQLCFFYTFYWKADILNRITLEVHRFTFAICESQRSLLKKGKKGWSLIFKGYQIGAAMAPIWTHIVPQQTAFFCLRISPFSHHEFPALVFFYIYLPFLHQEFEDMPPFNLKSMIVLLAILWNYIFLLSRRMSGIYLPK